MSHVSVVSQVMSLTAYFTCAAEGTVTGVVPLSSKAVAILRQMETVRENSFVFNITSGSLDALFRKLKRRSLLENLHFHDARREALTRLAKIYSPMELAKISGHRDLRILLNTYYAPTVEDLADKLE